MTVASSSPIKVALIDDEGGIRLAFTRLLEKKGIEVASYESGVNFLERYNGELNCILLDHNLPHMNGLAVLSELRNRGDTTPVVMISGQADDAMREAACRLGATGVIRKPTGADEVAAAIHSAVAGYKPRDR